MTPDALPDPIDVAIDFTGRMESLGIDYLVGGSLASSIHGEPRSTNDIDVLADLRETQEASIVEAMTPDYYVSASAVRQAIGSKTSFNAIHMGAAVKVDVFVAGTDPFNQERLRMRTRLCVAREPEAWMCFDIAEHSILRKLEWFRRGGEISERQWRDVISILRVQRGALDAARLDEWAEHLGVVDLLALARDESGGG